MVTLFLHSSRLDYVNQCNNVWNVNVLSFVDSGFQATSLHFCKRHCPDSPPKFVMFRKTELVVYDNATLTQLLWGIAHTQEQLHSDPEHVRYRKRVITFLGD